MKKLINEFKEFISRGNVIDLAIGVIVGGAFSSIVTSLVNNILTPLLGLVLGGIDFSNLKISIKDTNILYGAFIQSVIDFLIIATCIFFIIKVLNKFSFKKKADDKKEVKKDENIIILEEIRDLLKNKPEN